MKYEKYLIDELGEKHPRKNQYIIDLIRAEEEGKAKVSSKDHPYNKAIEKYKKDKKDLLAKAQKSYKENSSKTDDRKLKDLYKRKFMAEAMIAFYEENKDLSYDSELDYKKARLELEEIPKIIDKNTRLKRAYLGAEEKLGALSKEEIEVSRKLIDEDKKILKEKHEANLSSLKESYRNKTISKKAYKSEKEQEKQRFKDQNKSIDYQNPETSLKEELESIKYRIDKDLKTDKKILEGDLAELRRRTPVEVAKTTAFRSIVSAPLPGLGQILNGQVKKGTLFLLASLFIYLIAIPYALGFGNYQGQGLAGLVSLAQGGRRLDRSILFMIEGILALVFVVLAAFILIMSFRDVRKVEKREMAGIRPNNFFETKKFVSSEGFPYLITAPALLVIIFIVIVPILTAILISFTNMDPQNQNKFNWIGLSNYITIARGKGIAGQAFWHIFGWTIVWTLGASTLAILLGFVFALMVNNERVKGKKFFRTVYLLPWAIPAFITIMFFSIMTSRGGIITETANSLFGVGLDIKNNTMQTRLALILLQGWLGHSYIFLLTTGVLQAIPKDLYEAASIDGATGIQRTFKITIPLVLFQIAPMLINQYTFNFNNFSIIYLYNQGGPFNPQVYGNLAGSSDILISYIYKLTMENQYQAIGAAITVFISIILIVISYFGYKNSSAFKEY